MCGNYDTHYGWPGMSSDFSEHLWKMTGYIKSDGTSSDGGQCGNGEQHERATY